MKHKPINKKTRELVYNKYNGHCAYCGCELEYKDMQVDHIKSVYRINEQDDSIENLMPSCRMCNYYKQTDTIDEFRNNLSEMLMNNVRRPFDYRLAIKYGLIKENIHTIKFYFEDYEKNIK